MNIKSLLLGSAAALLAVSGARAADAVVVAEPEPMEYVRICDVYGAGFYYIPGTETCLKIGGLVRYQIDWTDNDDGWKKTTTARLKLDARSETEYGTFKRYIETSISNAGSMTLRYAYFELGGLMIGRNDTLFDGALSGEFDKGGGDFINQIRYTFDAGNGIAVSVSLEEADTNYDYTPNVAGKVSIAQGWGSVDLFAAYDATAEEYAVKGVAKFKATDALTLEALASYNSGLSFYGIGYEWSVGGYAKYQVSEKLAIGAGGQYFGDRFEDAAPAVVLGNNDWAIGAVVDYTVVENLTAKLAVNYNDGESYADGAFSGFLRLDASF
ncbi:porin [Aminobacter carboxidus]|uniref:Porin n=1 Tax=Aminobacter carboxidus TaxID=376165 RepID=A0ABR9GHF6_9HYPH|nr:porin [Aminobacter carboxidus]MBE1203117.1 porin [Aminobacter carboxidus]